MWYTNGVTTNKCDNKNNKSDDNKNKKYDDKKSSVHEDKQVKVDPNSNVLELADVDACEADELSL